MSFVTFIILVAMLLRLIVVKVFLTTLIDNLERTDFEQIHKQLCYNDKRKRSQEENTLHSDVLTNLHQDNSNHFSSFHYCQRKQ